MAECARCRARTDDETRGEYRYCEDCRDHFSAIERAGVVVEDRAGGDVGVLVTASETTMDGCIEKHRVEALARGKQIADVEELDALFVVEQSGARWELEAYLDAHPDVRQDVERRVERLPDPDSGGLLSWIRGLF